MDHPGVLPVIDADAAVAASRELAKPTPGKIRTGRLTRRLTPNGNTKTVDASTRRGEVTRAAMAGGKPSGGDGQDWRNELAEGQRGKAASAVSQRRSSHNSGSGFGVARPGYDAY